MNKVFENLGKHKDLILVTAVVTILFMLFVPIPPILLDVFLILNFSLAMLILLLTFYSEKPLSFSTFPSLLLIATLFRLGLNISSTRLILNDGGAGQVIGAIGSYVVGGNYVVGLVVFFILIVVQYVVVTNGAQRVAEVAARFTLDSMPGKQMSIDAELNMGLIDEISARKRRKEIEKEANFYGAMDGAVKFVKGDAIAGIIIIFINIIGGLSIGVAQMGLDWNEALHLYTLLTVGDGIVTQIPSLVIATGTGIIITRAATDATLGDELSKQITSSPKTLFLVAGSLLGGVFLPGLPGSLLFAVALVFCILGYFASRAGQVIEAEQDSKDEKSPNDKTLSADGEASFDSLLVIKPIELSVSNETLKYLQSTDCSLMARFDSFRKQLTRDLGVIAPKVSVVSENQNNSNNYELRIYGNRVGKGSIHFDKFLVIDPKEQLTAVQGIATKEPTFGLPALWVEEEHTELARNARYTVVDPETVLLTHLTELVKSHCSELLTRAETEHLINKFSKINPSIVNELVPNVLTLSEVQKVFQLLLKEKVSIRNLEAILECLVDKGKVSKDPVVLSELVRDKLKHQIIETFLGEDDLLNLITLAPALERELLQSIHGEGESANLALSPDIAEKVIQQLATLTEQALSSKLKPVLACYSPLRVPFKNMLVRALPQLSIISISEIPNIVSVRNFGNVKYDGMNV